MNIDFNANYHLDPYQYHHHQQSFLFPPPTISFLKNCSNSYPYPSSTTILPRIYGGDFILDTASIKESNNILVPSTFMLFNGTNTGQEGSKKIRSEKKFIPNEQKDEKYYERRRRNNQAAKKSRDARKVREDQIALKATILEHENALLRAQVLTLREESNTLRQLLIAEKNDVKVHTPPH